MDNNFFVVVVVALSFAIFANICERRLNSVKTKKEKYIRLEKYVNLNKKKKRNPHFFNPLKNKNKNKNSYKYIF